MYCDYYGQEKFLRKQNLRLVLMVGMILINVCQKRTIHEQMTNSNARRVE